MAAGIIHEIDNILGTLLHVGARVMEVSKELEVKRVWEREAFSDGGKEVEMPEADNDFFLAICMESVKECMGSGANVYKEFNFPTKKRNSDYSLRVLNNHPDKGYVFVLLDELLSRKIAVDIMPPIALPGVEAKNRLYETILNNIAADIVVFDSQLRFVYVNPPALKSTEVREWLIGKTDEDFCRLRNKPVSIAEKRMVQYKLAIAEKKIIEFEESSVMGNGDVVHHVRRVMPIFNDSGEVEYIVGFGLNITGYIETQVALKASEQTFANAFVYSGIGMSLFNIEGKWLDVNSAFCEMTGYAKEELLHRPFHFITYREDIETVNRMAIRLLKMDIQSETIQKRYVTKGNTIIWVLVTVSLVWNVDNTPKMFIAQVVDITNKKDLSNELRRRNVELEASKQSLVNKVDQLEELSYIIAHNLRGPAGNIKALAAAMRTSPAGNMIIGMTAEEGNQFIEESSDALLSSLDTLMEITSIKLNKEVPKDRCDVMKIVADINTQLHGIIFEKKAAINLLLEIEHIDYPKAYLENILYNLISNALKYSRPGIPPEVLVSVKDTGGRTQLIVKDNGLGINLQKYGARVFKLNQVFHQGYDSKGVGLYITKTQVESLGGNIEVRSQEKEGCEFIVTL
jgi:PAS domain S-box-containing protein